MEKMENKIDKEIMEEFERWSKFNRDYLQRKKRFTACVYMIGKDDKRSIMMVIFKNADQKVFMRNMIKLMALTNAKAYFFASDTKLTRMERDGSEPKVYDALVQLCFTPECSFQKILLHNGEGKPIKLDEFDGELKNYNVECEWDAWRNPIEINDEIVEKYNKFKKDNPDLFKEIA
jgi:hypothetical protein